MPQTNTSEKLMDLAEHGMRRKGYAAVSFRDLARDAGIKSSSVHYYFPQKHDLGVALVKRYGERFTAALVDKTQDLSGQARIRAFIALHRQALDNDGGICLCGVFGAESAGLPAQITSAVSEFFAQGHAWLNDELGAIHDPSPDTTAYMMISALEGAMILATVNQDISLFDRVADRLTTLVLG